MMKEITAVSLFTGAGGMDIGFERAESRPFLRMNS